MKRRGASWYGRAREYRALLALYLGARISNAAAEPIISSHALSLPAEEARPAVLRVVEGPRPSTPPEAEATDLASTQREDPMRLFAENGFPKSVPLFGSKFRFGIGGYIKLDALYDLRGNADRSAFSLSGIPPDEEPSRGYLSVQARESRFNVDVRYFGDGAPENQAYLEIDFFTAQAGFAPPRLRHAYLRWGAFLAGQTWSLLTDLRPLPFIIDFAFADSVSAKRTPQIRYQKAIHELLVLRVGLEMPETSGVDNPSALPGAISPRLPRAAAGLSLETDRGFVSLALSGTEIRWQFDTDGPSVFAWAAALNSTYYLDSARRGKLGLHALLGQGSAETVGVFTGQNANAMLRADGSLATIPTYHLMLSYGQRWTPRFSYNAAFAIDAIAPPEGRRDDRLAIGWSFHTNVIWHIAEPLQTGIEYMAGGRKNSDGSTGQDERLQGMVMYRF